MTQRGSDARRLNLDGLTAVYVSLMNGTSPPLAHLERDCKRQRQVSPPRVSTTWAEAEAAGARLCLSCEKHELAALDEAIEAHARA